MISADAISHLWDRIRTSLWFVPGTMALGALVLAILTPVLDRAVPDDWLRKLPLVFSGRAVGARVVLSTIATSMIATAGVVFSMTIVSLQLASSQFGPRLLRTFLRDRGNQIVLGTFVGIFLYCILVLPTVDTTEDSVFVPHIAVSIAVLLAIVGLGMLVYFIDHVAQSIHADAVIYSVTCELNGVIDHLFPEPVGDADSDSDEDVVTRMGLPAETLVAVGTGYLRFIDGDVVFDVSTERDLLVRIDVGPGQYVFEGDALASVWPAGGLTAEDVDRLRAAFELGSHRTPLQDALFAFEQLSEMAVRALSPGINDPTTAVHCIDRIGSSMARLASRPLPSRYRRDDDGALRIVAKPVKLADVLRETMEPIARNAGTQLCVWLRLLGVLEKTFHRARRSADQAALRGLANRFTADAMSFFDHDDDTSRISVASAWALRES